MTTDNPWDYLQQNPEFTEDWVSFRTRVWSEVLNHLAGQPARMLEIGCFEGRSSLWWLNNVLTHESSTLTCVDPWMGPKSSKAEPRFDRNIAASGCSTKVKKYKAESRHALGWLRDNHFDAAYVDGSHQGCDVLLDALMVLQLVKPGGVIIFDDYKWNGPAHHPPGPALDAFLQLCDFRIEVLHREYQLIVRRRQQDLPIGGKS